jgi:hypothetical protein
VRGLGRRSDADCLQFLPGLPGATAVAPSHHSGADANAHAAAPRARRLSMAPIADADVAHAASAARPRRASMVCYGAAPFVDQPPTHALTPAPAPTPARGARERNRSLDPGTANRGGDAAAAPMDASGGSSGVSGGGKAGRPQSASARGPGGGGGRSRAGAELGLMIGMDAALCI